jgi:hypothetical protein
VQTPSHGDPMCWAARSSEHAVPLRPTLCLSAEKRAPPHRSDAELDGELDAMLRTIVPALKAHAHGQAVELMVLRTARSAVHTTHAVHARLEEQV